MSRKQKQPCVLLIRSRRAIGYAWLPIRLFSETTTTEAEAQIQVAARATHAGAPVMPTAAGPYSSGAQQPLSITLVTVSSYAYTPLLGEISRIHFCELVLREMLPGIGPDVRFFLLYVVRDQLLQHFRCRLMLRRSGVGDGCQFLQR